MKRFKCEKHGDTVAVLSDFILLRYECCDCLLQSNKITNNKETEKLEDFFIDEEPFVEL